MAAAAKPAKSNKMKEDAPEPASSLNFLLRRMEALAGTGGFKVVTFSPTKTKTLVSVQAQGITVETTLPGRVDGLEGSWEFQYPTVLQAVAGRTSESLRVSAGTLYIAANKGRYEVSLIGAESSGIGRAERITEPTCEIEVNSAMRILLKEGLAAVHLTKSMSALPDITLHMLFTKKVATLIAFDRSQMSVFSAPNTTGQQFAITLPLPRAESLFKDGLGDATVSIKEGLLTVTSGSFRMSSSLPPAEEAAGVPIERVVERAKMLKDHSLPKKVFLAASDLKAFLENARSLSKTSALLRFEVDGSAGHTRVTITADGNSISAVLDSKAKGKFDFYLDIAYVLAIISKAKEALSLEMDDDSFLFKSEGLTYAAVLSTPPAKKATGKKAKKEAEESEEEEG